MAKFEKRIQAHVLRKKGKSIKTIAEKLDVSKSTVSLWCREIQLTEKQKEYLRKEQIKSGHKGRIIGAEINRKKKLENISNQEESARAMVGTLSERDVLMLGVGLYWGEGVKSGNLAMVNSDPDVILFARDWFEQLGVKRDEFRPYIYISEIHRNRSKKVLDFWSNHLSIPKSQFLNIIFLKGRPKKVYENHDSYYGILSLRVARSTTLKYKILGLIKASKKQSG